MKKEPKDCCYEEMSKGIGGQSIEQPYHDEPMISDYEKSHKTGQNWNWSGTKGGK